MNSETQTSHPGRILGALVMAVSLGAASTALAGIDLPVGQYEEVWLEPAYQDANKTVGNWGVAGSGQTGLPGDPGSPGPTGPTGPQGLPGFNN